MRVGIDGDELEIHWRSIHSSPLPACGERGHVARPFRHFAGIIGSSTYPCLSPPKCSVVCPPKISFGRSCGSSCRNGPQPVSSFLKFDSLPPEPPPYS